jgi:hypothetical protein
MKARETSVSRSAGNAGFALPMAVLILMITTGAVLTTMNQASSERRIVDSEQAGNAALVLAETGLELVATQADTWGFGELPDAEYDSVRVTYADGYVDVIRQRLRPVNGVLTPAIYLIRSRGVHTRGGWAGAPSATRVVTRYGTWSQGVLDVRAAWTSLTGLTKNGGSGTISGTDACGEEVAVAGVAVPTSPGYSQNGGSSVPSGSPPIQILGANSAEAGDAMNIDWDGIVSGDAVTFDLAIPSDSWPSFSDPDYWPIIYIDNPGGTFSLPSSGRGTLIIRGNFTISGAKTWNGVIMVGGAMTSNGNNTVSGAVISGLNVILGEVVGTSDVGNGTKTYRYNSCNVAAALQAFSGIRILSNTWFDGWALY